MRHFQKPKEIFVSCPAFPEASESPTSHNLEATSLADSPGIKRTREIEFRIKEELDSETETLPGSPIRRKESQKSIKLPMKTRQTASLTLVLDLDETLLHCSLEPIPDPDQVVKLYSHNLESQGYIKYRPFLWQFLTEAAKHFELVLFTASHQAYADQILRKIDPFRTLIRYRYYRHNCTIANGVFVKDLNVLGRDLKKVVIVDNSVSAFALQLGNGIPISSWLSDQNDRELLSLMSLVMRIQLASDVRPYLCNMFKLTTFSA